MPDQNSSEFGVWRLAFGVRRSEVIFPRSYRVPGKVRRLAFGAVTGLDGVFPQDAAGNAEQRSANLGLDAATGSHRAAPNAGHRTFSRGGRRGINFHWTR